MAVSCVNNILSSSRMHRKCHLNAAQYITFKLSSFTNISIPIRRFPIYHQLASFNLSILAHQSKLSSFYASSIRNCRHSSIYQYQYGVSQYITDWRHSICQSWHINRNCRHCIRLFPIIICKLHSSSVSPYKFQT